MASLIIRRVLLSMALLIFGTFVHARCVLADELCYVRYDNGQFIVDNSLHIDLLSRPDRVLETGEFTKIRWLESTYYSSTTYPIRLTSIGSEIMSVQFLFINDLHAQLTITLYDLRIDEQTTKADLELFFSSHRIEFSSGENNIATPFAFFYFDKGRLALCEFRASVLRHYADYYFIRSGERPWWLAS